MTITKEDNNSAGIVVTAEPDTDASMVTATAVAFEEKPTTVGGGVGVGQGNEAPIPPGHARFYCSKCRAVRENDYSFDICVGSRRCFCVCHYREDVVWIYCYCYCSHIFFLLAWRSPISISPLRHNDSWYNSFCSPTIFPAVPQLGDVRDATLSIPPRRENANGVQYCKANEKPI